MSDSKQIKELLRERVADLAPHLFPNGKKEGNHWCVGSIDGEAGKSFDVCIAGEKAGLWGDFAETEKHSRSLLDLWMRAHKVDFKTALREASEWLGLPQTKSKPTFPTLNDAVRFVASQLRMLVTRRDTYRDANGNVHFVVVRFDKKNDKQFRPFHQTAKGWVIADPPGKLPLFDLPTLMAPDLNPSSEPVFVVEGEKCVCALRDKLGLLATTSAHGSKAPHITDWEPLAGRTVVILPDNDSPGQGYAQTVAGILMQLSPSATVKTAKLPGLPPEGDCIEWIKARDSKPPEEIKAELLELVKDAEVIPPGAATDDERISFRSPSQILAMPRNPKANFFGDYLLGIAQSLVIAGIGGLGKSRLLLQLLVAFILERIWCGIETHHTGGKPWMLVQTQNSIQRLQDDLEPLKKYAGSDWPLVDQNLFIHTLETDRDLMLHLSDPKNARELESAIRQRNPIGVAFDPLNEIGIGDLSKDVDMMRTCNAIGSISRAGNPERAILIATHALTGLAGIKKAFGFEAAGFGRNSKVLQFWSRAFINAFPAAEDYSILGISCGKNNNGKIFSPFAVRLDPDTKIYELEPDFDMDALREQVERGPKKRDKYSPEIIAEMDWPEPTGGGERGQLDKKQLIDAVKQETGCSKTTAYRLIDMAVINRLIKYSKLTKIYRKK